MLDFLDDAAVTLMVTLSEAGAPVVPTVGSLTYSVRDHEGVLIPDLIDVPVTTGPTTYQVAVVIPQVNNAIAAGKRFERRTVVFSYLLNGVAKQQIETYRLIGFLNHNVTPGQVRSFVGLQAHELGDESIDLLATYLKIEKRVGIVELATALSSGTTQEIAANDAIRMQAVLDVLPSLRQRVAQSETNGLKGFSRPIIRDFSEIEAAASDLLATALAEVNGTVDLGRTLVALTQDADAITG